MMLLSKSKTLKNWNLVSKNMQLGLKINVIKTKLHRNKHVTRRPVFVKGNVIEEIQSHTYIWDKRVSLVETDIGNKRTGNFREVRKVSMSINRPKKQ